MTALSKYARLEATGLWRPTPDAQRREVIVSLGDSTIVITDTNDQALAHWAIPAVERANPGKRPAIFHPDGDPGETLELPAAEAEMTEAIETLRKAVLKARPSPGRLRWIGMLASVLAVAAAAVFWLPGAMQDHTLRVVPNVKRIEIGAALLKRIERVSGPTCKATGARAPLKILSDRLAAGSLIVLPDMARDSLHLPGGAIVIDRDVIEDFEDPDVAAGYVVTEMARRSTGDPLRRLLVGVGLRENFRLLTTGEISGMALDHYAEMLMADPTAALDIATQINHFKSAALRSTPYAYARDITGEATIALIEGDPMAGHLTEPLMSDANWLRLQSICGG